MLKKHIFVVAESSFSISLPGISLNSAEYGNSTSEGQSSAQPAAHSPQMRKCVKPVLQKVQVASGTNTKQRNLLCTFLRFSQLPANPKYILPRALSRTLSHHLKAVQGYMGTSAGSQGQMCEDICNWLLIDRHRE